MNADKPDFPEVFPGEFGGLCLGPMPGCGVIEPLECGQVYLKYQVRSDCVPFPGISEGLHFYVAHPPEEEL